ncbi:hypothetical protein B2J93_6700 [Marssonina coronariae]|uniref:Uncharacterized protein n=1 Tax=Diplocarpon coronariae TaxID=2795749 RepID=A0A218ZHP9_9HELO|nr:hypothetical protein B2J93_6700 [Marssonina coronariae]
MWDSARGFASTGPFPNSFDQEAYSPLMFAGHGQSEREPCFVQQSDASHPETMTQHYNDGHGRGFPPELGVPSHDRAYRQNQHVNGGAQFSSQSASIPPPNTAAPRPLTQINARAAELKAELVKRREQQASSATPPVTRKSPALAAKQTAPGEEPGSVRAARPIPTTVERPEQEINVDELISLHSKGAGTAVKPENNGNTTSSIQKIPAHASAILQSAPAGSIMGGAKPANLGVIKFLQGDGHPNGNPRGTRQTSHGSMSDGEIFEDESTPPRSIPATKPHEIQPGAVAARIDEAHSLKVGGGQSEKPAPSNRLPREESPPRRPVAIPQPQDTRSRADRWEDVGGCAKRDPRAYQSDYRERKQYPDPESSEHQRWDDREERLRRTEPNEQRREDDAVSSPREQKPPTLIDILPLDQDLREWLEITGYHNVPYRSKILNRRRAIAALDAKRDQLLAEMQAEERGGVPPGFGSQVPASPMLPPPIPLNRAGVRDGPASAAAGCAPERDRVVSNKRPYSDFQETRDEKKSGPGPVAMTAYPLSVAREPIPVRATITELPAENATFPLAVRVVETSRAGHPAGAVDTSRTASTIEKMLQSELCVTLRPEAVTEAVHTMQIIAVEVEPEVGGILVIVETTAWDETPRAK